MTLFSRRTASGLAAVAGLVLAMSAPCLAQSQISKRVSTETQSSRAKLLRAGGYNIVVRHGATFSNQADTDPFNFDKKRGQTWQRHLAMRSAGSACRLGRSTRASSIAPTRQRS